MMIINKISMQLGDLSKYRSELMGLSALLILICHVLGYVHIEGVIRYLLSLGNIGVDLFLFLSGMGMFYSLYRLILDRKTWYVERYKKLFVPYLVTLLTFEIIQFVLGKQLENGIWNYLLGLTSVGFFISGDGFWFIAALIPLYFLAPFYYKVINKYKMGGGVIALIIFHYLVLLVPSAFSVELFNNVIDNLQFVIVRAPSFVLGIALGNSIQENKKISVWWLLILIVAGIMFIVITRHLVYGYFFFTLPSLFFFCFLVEFCGKWFKNLIGFMGRISLESYILNGVMPKMIITFFLKYSIPIAGNVFPYVFACVISLPIGYGLHIISNKILGYDKGKNFQTDIHKS